jgi:branched-chain amino acid transport system substrate-binding protein
MRAQFTIPSLAPQSLDTSLVPPLRILWLLLLFLILFACVTAAQAQSDPNPAKPYATLNRQGVTYRGPVSGEQRHASDGTAVIGLILPLQGPQAPEGRAVLAAAQLAIEEEQARGPLPDGRHLKLAVRDETGQWGQASIEVLKLIEEDHALSILASVNGTTAHLADQIANKLSVPILTLSTDPSTTEANVPWLFRVGPSDTDQARAFCQRIYSDLGIRRVLLVTEADYDGRVGGAEFVKAAAQRNALAPARFEIADGSTDPRNFREALDTDAPEAIVLWTDVPVAEKLLPLIRNLRPSTPVFLCRKAAQLNASQEETEITSASKQLQNSAAWFSVDFAAQTQRLTSNFEKLYASHTGSDPGLAAEDTYRSIRIIAAAIRHAGASPTLLREYFANEPKSAATNQGMRFDPAGNSTEPFSIIRLGSFENAATSVATGAPNPPIP